MRYITIPHDVVIEIPGQKVPFAFVKNFVEQTATVDGKWGASAEKLFVAADIRAAFAGKNPGEVVALPEALWAELVDVVSHPSTPYQPIVMLQVMPMLRAILSAPETRPPTPDVAVS